MPTGIGSHAPQDQIVEITLLITRENTVPPESSSSTVSERRCTTNAFAKTITGIGCIATTLFFGAPVTNPLLIGTVVGGSITIFLNSQEAPDHADGTAISMGMTGLVLGILGGGVAGGVGGYYAWQPTVDFVYNPHIVFIAGIIGGAIIGLGGTLWVGSSYCEKKAKLPDKVVSV